MVQPPFKVRALYPYESEEPDDLTFNTGQVITVDVVEDAEWYSGSYTDSKTGQSKSGLFPISFVQSIAGEPVAAPASAAPEVEEDDFEDIKPVPVVQQKAAAPAAAPVPAPAPVPIPAPTEKQPSSSSELKSPVSASSTEQPRKRNAFQDRIAAFNTSTDVAPSPFAQPKPVSYAKKTFYAASSNSYVPQLPSVPKQVRHNSPPPQVPASEIVHYNDPNESEEEKAMPNVSLKDRIKLLQQQQAAEAARAEALATKKKTKSKVRKPSEGELEPVDTGGSLKSNRRESLESSELVATFTGGSMKSITSPLAEPQEAPLASVPESMPSILSPASAAHYPEPKEEEEEEEDEEEDDDDEEDEEEARRLALRERMAKISGGMGMHLGMGMPGMVMPGGFGGMPGATAAPVKKVKKKEEDVESRPQPIPILPFATPQPPAKIATPSDLEEDEEDESVTPQPRPLPPKLPVESLVESAGPPVANRELTSVIDEHRDDSESDESTGAWSDSKPQAPKSVSSAPPPVPPVRKNSVKSSGELIMQQMNVANEIGVPEPQSAPVAPEPKRERTRSKTRNRDSVMEYDEVVDGEFITIEFGGVLIA